MPARYISTFLAALCATFFLRSGHAQTDLGNPLAGFEQLKDFQTMRASSSDPDWKNGNADSRPIEPGKTLTLAELDGPGMIVHFWCTIAHPDPFYSRLLTLRIYWDGETNPSVECPIGDFFGVGHGLDRALTSLPVRVTSDGRGRNCYWPMPFRKSARITVSNDSDRRCNSFYYYIDWQKHPSLPKDTAYFHAMYRQEFPCVMGRNYQIANIVGRGHYVGTVQSVYLVSPGWYGEGDDFFFINGEKEPSLRGTGTEDYFCDGWGFREQSGPFYGVPLFEGYQTGGRSSAYRWHIPDPVVFTNSLRVEIEHKGSQVFPDSSHTGFIERDDLMSSVAYWYQIEPHKPWPAMPPAKDRLPFHDHAVAIGHEAVTNALHSDGTITVSSWRATTDDKQLWFRPASSNAWFEIPFQFDHPESADVIVKTTRTPGSGIYTVKLDDRVFGQLDCYSFEPSGPVEKDFGQTELAAGKHTLRFEAAGKASQSAGYFIGFDTLIFRVPIYSRSASEDLRQLQKNQ